MRDKRDYKFIKQYKNYELYEDIETGIKESFLKNDLGRRIIRMSDLTEEEVEATKTMHDKHADDIFAEEGLEKHLTVYKDTDKIKCIRYIHEDDIEIMFLMQEKKLMMNGIINGKTLKAIYMKELEMGWI